MKEYTHNYNDDFFNCISEHQAYFLGFFMADGWLASAGGARISSIDIDIISQLAEITDYANKITTSRNKSFNRIDLTGTTQYHLAFAEGSGITQFLKGQGFVVKKTGNEFIPLCIDTQNLRHFMRGLSDGDGTLGIYNCGHEGGKEYPILRWSLVSASLAFVKSISESLYLNGITSALRSPDRGQTTYRLQLAHADAVRLCNWIYDDATVMLQRKYNIYRQACSLDRQRNTWTNTEDKLVLQGILPLNRSRHQCYMRLWNKGLRVDAYKYFRTS